MSRLSGAFEGLRSEGRTGLVAYATAGDPDVPRTGEVLEGLARGGADVIEVGVPFSDPIADGPAIQRASERALAAGASLDTSLDAVAAFRRRFETPVVLFTYVNPVLRMSVERFVARAAEAGVDGVLMLDLPLEEAGPVHGALDARGIDQIFLISPTTSDVRVAEAARLGRGFLYAISRLGVTGVRSAVSDSAAPLVGRIRAATDLPVALGFGLSRPEHLADVGRFADAAVVGSAIVQTVAEAVAGGREVGPAVERFVRWLRGG
jgi:tryptophan synthase alpha chain